MSRFITFLISSLISGYALCSTTTLQGCWVGQPKNKGDIDMAACDGAGYTIDTNTSSAKIFCTRTEHTKNTTKTSWVIQTTPNAITSCSCNDSNCLAKIDN